MNSSEIKINITPNSQAHTDAMAARIAELEAQNMALSNRVNYYAATAAIESNKAAGWYTQAQSTSKLLVITVFSMLMVISTGAIALAAIL